MFKFNFSKPKFIDLGLFIFIGVIAVMPVALAHHGMGGKIPNNFLTGFLSGLAHPIIGLDHFSFVVASGLIAAGKLTNIATPISFVIATIIGTIIHLFKIDLPIVEIIVSISVIIFGFLLAIKNNPSIFNNKVNLSLPIIASFAGIFHGYAYGESIIGAEITPLMAYLLGFTIIQLIIAILAFIIGDLIKAKLANQVSLITRFLGLTIATIGSVYLFNSILG